MENDALADPAAAAAAERAAGLLGSRLEGWERVSGAGGYTPAYRLRIVLADGRTVFVKAASNDHTAAGLRAEARAYEALKGCDFLPHCFGYEDDGAGRPLLVLEDLTAGAHWPPPWRPGDVDRVLAMLEQVRPCASRFPAGTLPSLEDDRAELTCWHRVAAEPEPFLALGFCSRDWLEDALPTLIAADGASLLEGTELCHVDLRSDNVCLVDDGRTVLVDWNWARVGNSAIDIAGWAPSLRAEGGPLPEVVLPGEGALAALLAGYWAARAGLPSIPDAPRVREIQRIQLSEALPWAARALGLPVPDGLR